MKPKQTNNNGELRWSPPETDIDPVCGKLVHTRDAKPTVHDGLFYYFCSRDCREQFEAAPEIILSDDRNTRIEKLENSNAPQRNFDDCQPV